jgi:hypothetical protein
MRRSLTALALAAVWLLLAASPALADPAGPTNYRSVVTAVEDASSAAVDLDVEVLGGDAFLLVRVPAGRDLEVPGYDDEPYVRIRDDGRVEINHRSPTHWFNEDRYGADVPEVADAEATPVWRVVADEGAYAWHEHRIHWMSPGPPPQVDASAGQPQEVFDWEIPVLLDGEPVMIRGELTWLPGPPPWVPIAWVVTAIAAAALLLGRWRVPAWVPTVVVATAAAAAGIGMATGQPPGGEGDPFWAVLPGLALGGALVAGRLRSAAPAALRPRLLEAAATVPLLVWAVMLGGALTRPVVPEPLAAPLLRPVVAAALGLAAVALVEAGRAALGALPDPLDREPAEESPAPPPPAG